jgi:ribonuclease VapC
MVVDTSAFLAILLGEPECDRFIDALMEAPRILVSAATAVELGIVALARAGAKGEEKVDLLLLKCGAEIVAVDETQVFVARAAYRAYGKGRHPAGLNYGDCFSYALAKTAGEPLLYKGGDFRQTDIVSAFT